MTEDEALNLVKQMLPNNLRIIGALDRKGLTLTRDEAHVILSALILNKNPKIDKSFGKCDALSFASLEKSIRDKLETAFPSLWKLYGQ